MSAARFFTGAVCACDSGAACLEHVPAPLTVAECEAAWIRASREVRAAHAALDIAKRDALEVLDTLARVRDALEAVPA